MIKSLNNIKLVLLGFNFVFVSLSVLAQDLPYAKRTVEILSAPEMHGRGYVNKGDSLAAEFIKSEMALNGLKRFNDDYFQYFDISVNTLPGDLSLNINSKPLVPAIDFLALTPSLGKSGQYKTHTIHAKTSLKKINKLKKKGLKNKVLIIDNTDIPESFKELYSDLRFYNLFDAEAVIFLTDKSPPLTWGIYSGHLLLEFPSFQVAKSAMPKKIKQVNFSIDNKYFQKYRTQNVVGYVEGQKYPDSFFVFTAHYDHLGRMGKDVYFPGANDNASGVAMMLDLAGYFYENPSDYSIAFIACAAEEAGLLGSKYFTENPLFDLNKIKFLINLDMVSSGEKGLMVVNGQVLNEEFAKLHDLNALHNLLPSVESRGEAANSDHYFFYAKGVKSFFFYTMGGSPHYHNVYDTPDSLTYFGYNNLFRLITLFINDLSLNN